MSTITPLFTTFSSAITTNALLYLLSKTSFTATTFILYAVLSATDFAIWATSQSLIFLMLLWLDCGLRKSIPRYAPTFSSIRHRLITPLIQFQITILLCALPLFIYLLSHITSHPSLIMLSIGIYLAEGTTNILRSLYHAYFYHRFFNHRAAICTIADIILTLLIVCFLPSSYLLFGILSIRLCTTSLLAIMAITHWHQQPPPSIAKITINESYERTQFIKHSLFMWGTTILTSISERNFLLPFIIGVTGIATGNLFKVAHDGALLFYRLIIKTIGSADIALLAHVQTYEKMEQAPDYEQDLMQQSVEKLSTQIARLALPVLGIIIFLVPIGYWFYHDQFVFHAFLIMAIGYIIETIWIPYERVLEVKQNYKVLSIIYMIYTISIISLFFIFYMTWIGLMIFLIGIHGVRLVIGICMRYGVYRAYGM